MTMDKHVVKVVSIEYHRNGVSGEGFHIVNFKERDGRCRQDMIAMVFPTGGHVAVFNYDLLKAGNFKWMENSWRGDNYEVELRAAIQEHEAAGRED